MTDTAFGVWIIEPFNSLDHSITSWVVGVLSFPENCQSFWKLSFSHFVMLGWHQSNTCGNKKKKKPCHCWNRILLLVSGTWLHLLFLTRRFTRLLLSYLTSEWFALVSGSFELFSLSFLSTILFSLLAEVVSFRWIQHHAWEYYPRVMARNLFLSCC